MRHDNTTRAARLLRAYLDTLPPFRSDPELGADALQIVNAGEAALRPCTVFEFAGRQCFVNGVPIPAKGKGLPLAWAVLAAHQHRLGALKLGWIFPGQAAPRSLRNTILRAAADAERYSIPLASAILGIGTEHGLIVVKGDARGIICTSPRLAALCA